MQCEGLALEHRKALQSLIYQPFYLAVALMLSPRKPLSVGINGIQRSFRRADLQGVQPVERDVPGNCKEHRPKMLDRLLAPPYTDNAEPCLLKDILCLLLVRHQVLAVDNQGALIS